MIVTETVATTKVCPFMTHRVGLTNYVDPVLLVEKCLGSGCMAWKWAAGFSPEELERRKGYNPNPEDPKGYCGA